MAISLEQLYAVLPPHIGSEEDLDVILRKLGRIREGDNASLDALRAIVTHNRLVVKDADGRIVKAASLPRVKSENDRLAELAAEERARFDLAHPPEMYENKAHKELVRAIEQTTGPRFAALESQVATLQADLDDARAMLDSVLAATV